MTYVKAFTLVNKIHRKIKFNIFQQLMLSFEGVVAFSFLSVMP